MRIAQQAMDFGDIWIRSTPFDPTCISLFESHYSARPNRPNRWKRGFVQPGEKIVLRTADASALFVWVLPRYRNDGQVGVECSVFRNEGKHLSSF